MARFPFHQVDVFTAVPYKGNALAVVSDAGALTDAQMAGFANWTNLSETTFLLPPTDERADYRVRIFTPSAELPFAGHPTLGSCHVWLAGGGEPKGGEIIQECGVGLVRLRRDGALLAFAAPPLIRSGPADELTLARIIQALRIAPEAIQAAEWVDNGPGWVAVWLGSRDELLALKPDFGAMGGLNIGAVAPWVDGEARFEVRAFVPELGVPEDPVTGSLNAGLAQWFYASGRVSGPYIAAQGTVLGRAGRVLVERIGPDIWIGGQTCLCIAGAVTL